MSDAQTQQKPKSNKWKYIGYFVLAYLAFNTLQFASKLDWSQMAVTQTGYSTTEAQSMCIDAIKGIVRNPSTLDIKRISGYASKTLDNGTILITQSFSAKNGFGAEKSHDAYCTLTKEGEFDIKINEQESD